MNRFTDWFKTFLPMVLSKYILRLFFTMKVVHVIYVGYNVVDGP